MLKSLRFLLIISLTVFIVSCSTKSDRGSDTGRSPLLKQPSKAETTPPPAESTPGESVEENETPVEDNEEIEEASEHLSAVIEDIAPKSAPYVVELKPLSKVQVNKPVTFRMSLIDENGRYAQHKDLRVVDGKRVHTVVVAANTSDEEHFYPRPDNINAEAIYEFTVTPKTSGKYNVMLDIVSKHDDNKYVIPAHFIVEER